MKWAISRQKLRNPNGLNFDNLEPGEKPHFEPLSLGKDSSNGRYLSDDLRTELKSTNLKYDVWVIHPLDRNIKKKAKRKYEAFVAGFLEFYDRDFLEYLMELNGKSDSGVTVDLTTLKKYFTNKGLVLQTSHAPKLQLEHKIFFEWGQGGKATDEKGGPLDPYKDYVRIYISPPAGNPDPPRPPGPPPPESSQ